jgi:hypothetical protein
MQTAYEIGRIKVNFILICDDSSVFEDILKLKN